MDLIALVMEARNNRKQNGINVSDDTSNDKESVPSDYSADIPSVDTGDNKGASDNEAPSSPDQSDGNDYGADIPDVDDNSSNSDEPTADDTNDKGTDYGKDMPTPNGNNNEEQGDNNQPQEDSNVDTPPDDNAEANQGDGENPPNDETGTDPEGSDSNNLEENSPEDTGVDNAQLAQARTKISTILLLRSFIRMYQEINRFMKKISESRKRSLLGTVTFKQVRDNLDKLATLVYKYIVISFDSSSYEINLYNYNYFFEIMNLNLEMIRKVKEVEDKSDKNKE